MKIGVETHFICISLLTIFELYHSINLYENRGYHFLSLCEAIQGLPKNASQPYYIASGDHALRNL
jgi:hypothetical protein